MPQSDQIQIWHPENNYQGLAVTHLERALSTLIGNAEERRAIYYFREKAAPVLSGSLDSSFWSRLVLQVGDSEPAVRLAIMAVGSLFEHVQYQESEPPTKDSRTIVTGRRYQFAIQCYNKAIAALMKRLEQQDSSEEVALLTCILFICVEFLQGNEAEALALCVKGSKVLHSMQPTDGESDSTPVLQRKGGSGMIVDDIVPIFTRLGILSTLFGQPIDTNTPALQLADPPPPELSYSFPSLAEARIALYDLMEKCQQVIRAAMAYKRAPDDCFIVPDALFTLQCRMLSNLDNWSEAFMTLDCSSDPSAVYSDVYASTLLRMYHLITYIWVATCLDKSESAFDVHMAEFTSIVTFSESLLAKGTAANALPRFTFEMGLIPPLYFTAINCRHPTLRRKALALMRQGSKRESLWDAEPVAKVAERVIELEECGFESGTDAWPEEKYRIHDAAIGRRVMTWECNGFPVEFKLRSRGLDQDFSYITEFISI